MLVASVRDAVTGLTSELLEDHIRNHVTRQWPCDVWHANAYRLISIPAELVAVFILDAGLNPSVRPHFPTKPAFIPAFAAARRPVSRTAIHIIIVATPVSARGSMILILVHHTAHLPMHLTHAIHIHAVVSTILPGSPIAINARALGALTISFARLI